MSTSPASTNTAESEAAETAVVFVEQVSLSGPKIRSAVKQVKVMCVPGQQFMVQREAYTRIQKAFEENGISFAPRRVIVEASTPALAAQVAAEILENEAEKRKKPADDRG